MENDELAYRAVCSRDPRFDGVFVTAVSTTGIYCRPSCPARTPLRRHVTFFPSAAAARHAGYRACKRCRPDAAPGSPQWDLRADTAARALALVRDGVVEREGVGGLAERLGYSQRQVRRILHSQLGVGPLELAASNRLDVARALLEGSALPIAEVAFAAGFGSLRQFNDAARRAFGEPPSALRERRLSTSGHSEAITLDLAYRPPLDLPLLLERLDRDAVPGVEHRDTGCYRRSLRLPRGAATMAVALERPRPNAVRVVLALEDLRDLPAAVSRARRILDLDADPEAITECLCADDVLAPLLEANPGLRVPAAPDPDEALVRALFPGRAGRRHLAAAATPLPARLAGAGLDRLLPAARSAALRAGATGTQAAVLDAARTGALDLGVGTDRDVVADTLVALLPRSPARARSLAAVLRGSGFGDPDAYAPGPDHARRVGGEAVLARRAESWRPWRAYALAHLDQAATSATGKVTT